ncbi:MAG: helix-turn-helix transcriptional regulator [Bacteroidaceae bacterium]|nr:helix-turn-helix transcriptional regulator [Bacteroidaceae bacterium]
MLKGGGAMFINKARSGDNNICGWNIATLRKAAGLSQNQLAGQLQLHGLDVDKNAIQRIEAGKRFVTDIELVYLADVLKVSYDTLLNREEISTDPIDK